MMTTSGKGDPHFFTDSVILKRYQLSRDIAKAEASLYLNNGFYERPGGESEITHDRNHLHQDSDQRGEAVPVGKVRFAGD